ncbi:ACP S-malonyltransferase [Rhodovibrio salinarum]|uniref:Malonyl CoA-acyl carrier protein transacylase n=1 Tax=Rhodovibrio salinarum TaxID=1087 RepID=A0A934QJ47_9PROT|nr:ACP S-malonyltransferase [Rhodovibrio salinarum]MBK1697490.1 [acyl-carrier-protein] S-malonyltransferase [Rhodovibrio salinarum]
MARAFVFPGQGSQEVGMGRELAESFPAARYIFQEVDDALGQDLSRLMFEGPEDELVLTENAQPALMAVSLATVRAVEEQGGFALSSQGAFVAGHSLGEYSALAAMDALSAGDAAKLLRLRGQAMQRAVPVGQGAMSAILGLDLETVQAVADEASRGGVCSIANDNAPGQVVISGHAEAVERAIEIAKQKGAKRAVMLNVSAPFHCALMQPAAEEMERALAEVEIHAPNLPVVSNVTAYALESPDEIRNRLCEQIVQPVRWRESVAYMRDKGVDRLYEIGHGKVLSGLAKRIDRKITAMPVGAPGGVQAFLNELEDA